MLNKLLYTGIASTIMFASIGVTVASAQGKAEQVNHPITSQVAVHPDIADQMEIQGCVFIPGIGWVC